LWSLVGFIRVVEGPSLIAWIHTMAVSVLSSREHVRGAPCLLVERDGQPVRTSREAVVRTRRVINTPPLATWTIRGYQSAQTTCVGAYATVTT
jgi:hypothetical protein